jgi:hypothetical protein
VDTQSWSGRFVWRRENSFPPTGIRSSNRPARSVVAIPTTRLKLKYSKTCLKRNAIVPVFFSVFTGFRFTKGCFNKTSTKNMIA